MSRDEPTRSGRRMLGAGLSASLVLYLMAGRPWLRSWGASQQEATQPLPGDDLVAARWHTTRAVSIAAPSGQVWPWLVQMGYERGGWYSYDWLERRVGAGSFAEGGSATRVIPQLQSLAVGDTVALSAAGGPRVAVLQPVEALVLHYRMNLLTSAQARPNDRAVLNWTWAFILTPTGEASCRLVVRVRADYRPPALFLLLPLLEPAHFLMETKMLRTIQRRASRVSGTPAARLGRRGKAGVAATRPTPSTDLPSSGSVRSDPGPLVATSAPGPSLTAVQPPAR